MGISLNKSTLQVLSNLSHELRNPIATIASGLELLEFAAEKEKFEKTRNILIRQVEQLDHLVEDLLDLSRISNDKIRLKKESFHLNQLVNWTVEDHSIRYKEKGISLQMVEKKEDIYINGDPQRLRQVIENLLHNAFKFTNRGGSVALSVDRQENEVMISIKDTGIGIPANMIPLLFDPFVQAEAAPEQNSSGLGLGLSISKEIIELHGGRIEAHSEGPGKGSEFVIRLPIEEMLP